MQHNIIHNVPYLAIQYITYWLLTLPYNTIYNVGSLPWHTIHYILAPYLAIQHNTYWLLTLPYMYDTLHIGPLSCQTIHVSLTCHTIHIVPYLAQTGSVPQIRLKELHAVPILTVFLCQRVNAPHHKLWLERLHNHPVIKGERHICT